MMEVLIQSVRKNSTQSLHAHGRRLWQSIIYGKGGIHTAQKGKQRDVLTVGHCIILRVVACVGPAHIIANSQGIYKPLYADSVRAVGERSVLPVDA